MKTLKITRQAIKDGENFLCGLELPEYHLNVYLTYIGGEKVEYHVFYDDKILFSGKDFRPSPLRNQDDIESVVSLLGFITLKPGDTDKEYFEGYTKAQLKWANSSLCEKLNTEVNDFENNDEYQAKEYFNKRFIS